MRIGKRPDKSRYWKKAGAYAKPKYASAGSVVGQLSPDLIQTVYLPEIRDRAAKALEEYADVLLLYEEQLQQLREPVFQSDLENETTTAFEAIESEEEEILIDEDDTEKDDAADEGEEDVLSDNNEEIKTENLPPPPPVPVFRSQYWVDEATNTLNDVSEHFMAKSGGWKAHVNAARFERMLDEEYGMFRPFIVNHPEIEHLIRSFQRRYRMGDFGPFRKSDPPIPRTTTIILLFMMQRGQVRADILIFAALFLLVGLQPWALVVVVAVFRWLLNRRQQRPLGTMSRTIPLTEPYYRSDNDTQEQHLQSATAEEDDDEIDNKQKKERLLNKVGTPLEAATIDMAEMDAVILGCGPAALYPAALLSRAGRKVLVLSPRDDASGCMTLELDKGKLSEEQLQIPFDVDDSNISRISQQQQALAPALCTNTDYQGGIRFAQIGSEADGYTFQILAVPGMGMLDSNRGVSQKSSNSTVPFIVQARGGLQALMDEAAAVLGDGWPMSDGQIGNSTTGAYAKLCEELNKTSGRYYQSKVLPESVNNFRGMAAYEEAGYRQASQFLDKAFPLNAHTRSLMAALGAKDENSKPSSTSMAVHVTNICNAINGQGMHYPVGGPRALCMALAHVIEQSGGHIVTGANTATLLFEEIDPRSVSAMETTNSDPAGAAADLNLKPPICVGVKLQSGQEYRFAKERYSGKTSDPVIISMEGFINTMIRLMPPEIRTKYKVPRGLPALTERRPIFHILFLLKGSAQDLNVTGADYHRVPGAGLARDEIDPDTGAVTLGEIGWLQEGSDEEVNASNEDDGSAMNMVENINKEASAETATKGNDNTKRKKRHNTFEQGLSWLRISFPSAKDPSFESRHGKYTTCVATIEADDDFVVTFDTKPKFCQPKKAGAGVRIEAQRLTEKVEKDLLDIFPQLEGKVERSEIRGPFLRGLKHNPERYAAKGVRPDTPYQGLYMGGSDLTIGDSFSGSILGGWLVANAVMGYSSIDYLFLRKNITADLEQFLEQPNELDTDDVAVPFEQVIPVTQEEEQPQVITELSEETKKEQ